MKKLFIAIGIMTSLFRLNAQNNYQSAVIAESDYQWTGITVSHEGRIFVNFPTWEVESPFKVAEMIDGKTIPFPSEEENNRFVCVQSVVVDESDRLWILDPANPRFKGVVKSGAKLYLTDLKTNQIIREYTFPKEVAPVDSYLNDIRIDAERGFAYITDSQLGGIVVLDINSGKSWRALDSSVEMVKANLEGITFPTTGFWRNKVHSDGIELSKDGETLYFTALTGDVLYRVPTKVLRNQTTSTAQKALEIKIETKHNVPTDGLLLVDHTIYMGDLPNESIRMYDLESKTSRTLDLGFPVRWADSFTADKKGNIYFTTSQINYPVDKRETYKIIKMKRNETTYPRAFSHIGITVPNLDEAVKFYREVMGWYVIMEPTEIKEENETAIGQMCIDVFGEGWGSFRIAHLATSDKIGIEIFEFKQAAGKRPEFNPFTTGLFHFSVQDPDIEGLIGKIVAAGGKQRMPIREYYPNEKPFKMCYVEDPFGVVFEIYTHSYEMTYSAGAY